MTKLFFSLLLLSLTAVQSYADGIGDIRQALEQSSASRIQEKVFVHTDNQCYFVGDTLWYKAYVVRADNLQPTDMSRILYVELLSPDGLLVERQQIVINPKGYTCGQFTLRDSLYSGYYELRAYTRWMLNFNVRHHRYRRDETWSFYNKQMAADYFRIWDGLYSRVLPVYSKPEEAGDYDVRSMYQRPKTRLPKQKKEDLLVSFFPEGGQLIEGVPNRVAFEVTNQHGEAVDIKGTIAVDETTKLDIKTEYMGRGAFTVTPRHKRLKARFTYLNKDYSFNLPKSERKTPEIYYAGNSISGTYLKHLCKLVEGRDFSVNVISKSGTTTEPAIAFRVFKKMLEERYGKEGAAKRIYATTDKSRGALKKLATEEGYETFVVPDDVGGRFSVLTAVGLLPIAVSGADITKLMEGAASGRDAALNLPFEQNDAMLYAAIRNILLRKGKSVEITCNYEPSLHYVAEWWKQLFGESEGKDQRGLFPASVDLTTDLHSMGQFIQDGARIMFETVLCVDTPKEDITIEAEPVDLDGLNYLAGKNMDFVNKSAMNGTVLAHTDGHVPNLMIHIPEENEFFLGQLFYMYEFACGVSGYTLGVNPFDQPGVESYKKNMFALLGKPGYEAEREVLLKRL